MVNMQNICNFLKSLNFHYSTSWVSDCVDYYLSNNPSITEHDLKEEVKNQWLLLNLRDVKVAVFPPNLTLQNKVILNGKYVVQVEAMVDSGQSKYSQLQSMLNAACDNIQVTSKTQEPELTPRRCLTLLITDGVQNLNAMEYETIPALKLNDPDQPPGFKMLILGPVTVRKGMFLLTQRNVTVCGGEVDVLAETHKLSSLLMASLGIDRTAVTSALAQMPTDVQRMLADEDDFLLDIAMDTDQPNSTRVPSLQSNVPLTTNEAQSYFEDESVDEILAHDVLMSVENEHLTHIPIPSTITQGSNLRPMPSPMINEELGSPALLLTTTINSEPYVYLAQVAHLDLEKDTLFKVKAVILTLLTKISYTDGAFTLKAQICDGSCSVDVQFSSDILENLLGYSPIEINKLSRERKKNSVVAASLKLAYAAAKQKLISLNCIFYVQFFASKAMPCVLHLEEITCDHLKALEARKL